MSTDPAIPVAVTVGAIVTRVDQGAPSWSPSAPAQVMTWDILAKKIEKAMRTTPVDCDIPSRAYRDMALYAMEAVLDAGTPDTDA